MENKQELIKPRGLGWRHVQTFLLFTGMLLAFAIRANISMAIVDMTNENNENYFKWDNSMKSYILSSFFWGYVILQIPGGELARRVGGSKLFTISIAVNSIVSLAVPLGATIAGWKFVVSTRIVQGLTQGVIYPSTHHLISQWVPVQEKGLLATIIYAGGQLGIAVQLLAGGFLAAAWGWQSIFYVNGVLGFVWTVAYIIFGASSPEKCSHISTEELTYIQRSLGRDSQQKQMTTPWRSILTSLPFLAVVVTHCGQNWGFFTLMTEMPTYMDKVLHFDLKSNGVLSSLPYIMMFLLSFPLGAMTDLIIAKKWLNVTNTRKVSNTIGLWGPACALLGLTFVPSESIVLAVVMLVTSVAINAGIYTGYNLMYIDLAPNFTSNLMGIGNCMANIVSIIAPLACGSIVKDVNDPAEWHKVFYVAAGVYFITNLFFIIFSTSKEQSWNNRTDSKTNDAQNEKEKQEDENAIQPV